MGSYADRREHFEDINMKMIQKEEIEKFDVLGASGYIRQLLARTEVYDINEPTRELFKKDLEKIVGFEKDIAEAKDIREALCKMTTNGMLVEYMGITHSALLIGTHSRKDKYEKLI